MNAAKVTRRGVRAPFGRIGRGFVAVVALFLVGGATLAAASGTTGAGAGKFAATFDARAGLPLIAPCPALGPDGQKIEARYEGTFAPAEFFPAEFIPAEFVPAEFRLEILFDRSSGVGTAEGTWQLADPKDGAIVARGKLMAAVQAAGSTDPALQLDGVLIGLLDPADPDLPEQRFVGNFVASVDQGATFPHLKGTVGDPSVGDPTVGDPTGLAANPAVLLPAVKC